MMTKDEIKQKLKDSGLFDGALEKEMAFQVAEDLLTREPLMRALMSLPKETFEELSQTEEGMKKIMSQVSFTFYDYIKENLGPKSSMESNPDLDITDKSSLLYKNTKVMSDLFGASEEGFAELCSTVGAVNSSGFGGILADIVPSIDTLSEAIQHLNDERARTNAAKEVGLLTEEAAAEHADRALVGIMSIILIATLNGFPLEGYISKKPLD